MFPPKKRQCGLMNVFVGMNEWIRLVPTHLTKWLRVETTGVF